MTTTKSTKKRDSKSAADLRKRVSAVEKVAAQAAADCAVVDSHVGSYLDGNLDEHNIIKNLARRAHARIDDAERDLTAIGDRLQEYVAKTDARLAVLERIAVPAELKTVEPAPVPTPWVVTRSLAGFHQEHEQPCNGIDCDRCPRHDGRMSDCASRPPTHEHRWPSGAVGIGYPEFRLRPDPAAQPAPAPDSALLRDLRDAASAVNGPLCGKGLATTVLEIDHAAAAMLSAVRRATDFSWPDAIARLLLLTCCLADHTATPLKDVFARAAAGAGLEPGSAGRAK